MKLQFAGGVIMDFNTIIAYAFGAVILYILIWIFYKPLKVFMKYVGKAAIGCISILVFNFLLGFLGLNIGVNLVTSFVVGILGLPGICLLLFLQKMVSF